jgi:hypothetical protein
MAQNFLQRADNPEKWEEVDRFTFEHCGEAVMELGGAPRYSGNWAILDSGRTVVKLTGGSDDANPRVLGILCRILGVGVFSGQVTGGWLDAPEFVPFEGKGRADYLHQKDGGDFVPRKKKAA